MKQVALVRLAAVGAAAGAAMVLLVVATGARRSTVMVSEKSFAEAPVPVNYVRKVAYTVPVAAARTQQLVSTDSDLAAKPLGAAEEARCVGLLHACQTWLELKDGEKNSIVITSPADDTKELVNHNIMLPESGAAIPSETWSVMKEACKYGLSDLASCDKPSHWPHCTGAECHTDAAKAREGNNAETTLVSLPSSSTSSTSPAATKRIEKRRSKGKPSAHPLAGTGGH